MRFTLCLAAVLAVAVHAPAAHAQVSAEDRATARTLSFEGEEALQKKDYARAADRFARAESLIHVPTLLLGLARANAGLGKLVAAQEQYMRIVREGAPPGASPAVLRAVADATKEVEAVRARVPSVVIDVVGGTDAKVTLDGVPVSSAALGVKRAIDPGAHVFRAEAAGFAPATATITVAEGKTETVTLRLAPAAAAGPVAAPIATSVATPVVTPPAGPNGGSPPAGAAPAKTSAVKAIGFAAIGLGGAGLIAGGITGAMALGAHSTLVKEGCTKAGCADVAERSSYYTLGAVSTAGFIVGGILAAGGVVMVVTAPKTKVAKDAWIAPRVGLGYVGLVGAF
jgi:hypothetical protein